MSRRAENLSLVLKTREQLQEELHYPGNVINKQLMFFEQSGAFQLFDSYQQELKERQEDSAFSIYIHAKGITDHDRSAIRESLRQRSNVFILPMATRSKEPSTRDFSPSILTRLSLYSFLRFPVKLPDANPPEITTNTARVFSLQMDSQQQIDFSWGLYIGDTLYQQDAVHYTSDIVLRDPSFLLQTLRQFHDEADKATRPSPS